METKTAKKQTIVDDGKLTRGKVRDRERAIKKKARHNATYSRKEIASKQHIYKKNIFVKSLEEIL